MQKTNTVKYIITTIGTIIIYIILMFLFVFLNIKYSNFTVENHNKNIFEVIWDTIFGPLSASFAIVDIVTTIFLIRVKHPHRVITICLACTSYLMVVFNNIAIKYPLSVATTAIINFSLLLFIVIIVLSFNKSNIIVNEPSQRNVKKIQQLINRTSNKKIIAVQLYEVQSCSKNVGECEKIVYDVALRESFARRGHDINSISSITYEMDRSLVDEFQLMLAMYQKCVDNGEQCYITTLLAKLDEQIQKLKLILKSIETDKRDITKEDCCVAKMLSLYLAIKKANVPGSTISQSDYIGEIYVDENDFELNEDTFFKLFTLVRTGILGAILLDETQRHVFKYRKNGIKNGRQYCCTQIKCEQQTTSQTAFKQNMDIVLYTIENQKNDTVAPYVMQSIKSSEAQISLLLNKLNNNGGDDNEKESLDVNK